MVNSHTYFFKNGSQFKLIWSNLIVTGFNRNAKFVAFNLQFTYVGEYSFRNRAEVMIFQLLSLCSGMALMRSRLMRA